MSITLTEGKRLHTQEHAPSIRQFAPDEWRTYRDLRLRALADSPDAFESTFARERVRPDEEWARRLMAAAGSSSDAPLVAYRGDVAAGLAWVRVPETAPDVAQLFQVWVAPEHRGHGVGQLLLQAAASWARYAGARTLALDVTCGDTPAMRLYLRAGCVPFGEPEPIRPGSAVQVQPLRLALGERIEASR